MSKAGKIARLQKMRRLAELEKAAAALLKKTKTILPTNEYGSLEQFLREMEASKPDIGTDQKKRSEVLAQHAGGEPPPAYQPPPSFDDAQLPPASEGGLEERQDSSVAQAASTGSVRKTLAPKK